MSTGQRYHRPEDIPDLAIEVILTVIAILRDMMQHAMQDDYRSNLEAAKRTVSKAAILPECNGSNIGAAQSIFDTDQRFGNTLNNGQKAMLFIAAVELTQEQAGS
jgi:hypothetical protein